MMKNVLILHGAGNNSQGNWFPWLKDELERKGYKVWSPDLPNSDVPNLKDWLEVIFSNKDWNFNEKSIIAGHYKREMVTLPFKWIKIKSSSKHFYFIHSDNDKYQCGEENGKIFQKNLRGELIVKKGQGHFNLEVSPDYKKFPLLLEIIEI